jgi:hypothetical protein
MVKICLEHHKETLSVFKIAGMTPKTERQSAYHKLSFKYTVLGSILQFNECDQHKYKVNKFKRH